MIKNKKGNNFKEFLTTYGWVFLIVLSMIGGLSYFGVFTFDDTPSIVTLEGAIQNSMPSDDTEFGACINTCTSFYDLSPGYVKNLCLQEQTSSCLAAYSQEECQQVDFETICEEFMAKDNSETFRFLCLDKCAGV